MRRLIIAENEITDKMYESLAELKIEKEEDFLTKEEEKKLKEIYKTLEDKFKKLLSAADDILDEFKDNKELLGKTISAADLGNDLFKKIGETDADTWLERLGDTRDGVYFYEHFEPSSVFKTIDEFKEGYVDKYWDDYAKSIKTIDEYNKEKDRLNNL